MEILHPYCFMKAHTKCTREGCGTPQLEVYKKTGFRTETGKKTETGFFLTGFFYNRFFFNRFFLTAGFYTGYYS